MVVVPFQGRGLTMRDLAGRSIASRFSSRRALLAICVAASMVPGHSAAKPPPTVIRGTGSTTVYLTGPSDAESVAVLSGIPGYKNAFWWDHANLTVAVRGSGNSDPVKLQAMRDAIEIWHEVLADRIPQVTLTDVTDTKEPGQPDIVLRYVPHAGGVQWSGVANCGVQKCLNVIVRTDVPPGEKGEIDADQESPLRVERTTLHELGHALGLGHASPIDSSLDLMGYGWSLANPDITPILSDCDVEGLNAAFGWLLKGEAPHPSVVDKVICTS